MRTRAALVLAGCVVAGCASTTASKRPGRVWIERNEPLPDDAPAFALAARGDRILTTPLGSWNEPLDVRGLVLSSGRRRFAPAIPLREPEWRATHELALRVGDERVELQYDLPAGEPPVEPGEQVRVVAHSMSQGMGLAFSLAVLDEQGEVRLIGVRTRDPRAAMLPLPAGWSIAPGPEIAWACGRGVVVRGPGGEIVAEPGRTAVAALGPSGERYAVDVVVPPGTPCDAPDPHRSVVVRRLPEPTPPATLAALR